MHRIKGTLRLLPLASQRNIPNSSSYCMLQYYCSTVSPAAQQPATLRMHLVTVDNTLSTPAELRVATECCMLAQGRSIPCDKTRYRLTLYSELCCLQ